MTAKEDAYVEIFRRLVSKKEEIAGLVLEFRKICTSLDGWQKTAGELARSAVPSLRPEWCNDRLAVPSLRALLVDYHSLLTEVERQWAELKRDKLDIGHADPGTVSAPG